MKKIVPGIFILLALQLKCQTVTSTCAAPGNIYQLYQRDADRLALRNVFHTNSTYMDSVKLLPALRSTYKAAMIAVYNATQLKIRDTIVNLLQIHTKPDPELNTILVKATSSNAWMTNLQTSTLPTGNPAVDDLIYRYNLKPLTYFQGTSCDVAVFKCDSSLNMPALSNKFKTISTVVDAEPGSSFNDVVNITDSINQGFTMLTYSYGWGSCENGCDHRSYWTFKVFPNCSVEYVGHTGEALPSVMMTGVQESTDLFEGTLLYPNPANNRLFVKLPESFGTAARLELINPLGQTVFSAQLGNNTYETDLSAFAGGMYYVRLSNGQNSRSFKLVKE